MNWLEAIGLIALWLVGWFILSSVVNGAARLVTKWFDNRDARRELDEFYGRKP